MRKIYVASPYRGDIKKNTENAKKYADYIASVEYAIPIVPHLYFTTFLDDDSWLGRYRGTRMGMALLEECQEMRVFCDEVSEGMIAEIKKAQELSIPIKFYDADMTEINYDALIINKKIGPGYRKILAEAHGDCFGAGCPYAGDCGKTTAEAPAAEAPAKEDPVPAPALAPAKVSFFEKFFHRGGGRHD